MMTDTKKLAEKIRNNLNQKMGKEIARSLTSKEELLQVDDWIEMPEYFELAVGGKGFPCGHISQIVGESDTGKTTLLMSAMISTQKAGGIVFMIDSEHKFSFDRFALMGGVPEDIITISVESLEEAWNAFDEVSKQVEEIRASDPDVKILLAWDSIAASVPDAILDSEAEQKHVSVEAKINNTQVRRMRKRVRKNNIAAIFINHTYMSMPKFGIAKEIVKGGSEIFFMSTLIVKTKRRAWLSREIKSMKQKYGIHALLEVFKGHLGGRKTTTEFYIVDKGILDKNGLDDYKKEIKGVL